MNGITVVIPTYNRPAQLSRVLDHLLASEAESLDDIEVIVVDDGSPESAAGIIAAKVFGHPFDLKYVDQENAGPAAARNHGFRLARNEIVLFVDDDVLVLPDVLLKHFEAHADVPGGVIHGPYPYVIPDKTDPEYRFLNGLVAAAHVEIKQRVSDEFPYARVNSVASGNLSVEKRTFGERVYEDRLEIPASEEFEMDARLHRLGIPIYFAPEILAWHLQPATIEGACVQNFKYGLGMAEVAIKRPKVLELEAFRRQYEYNRGTTGSEGFGVRLKKVVRGILAREPFRLSLIRIAEVMTRLGLPDTVLFPVYRAAVSINMTAGVRKGEKIFSNNE